MGRAEMRPTPWGLPSTAEKRNFPKRASSLRPTRTCARVDVKVHQVSTQHLYTTNQYVPKTIISNSLQCLGFLPWIKIIKHRSIRWISFRSWAIPWWLTLFSSCNCSQTPNLWASCSSSFRPNNWLIWATWIILTVSLSNLTLQPIKISSRTSCLRIAKFLTLEACRSIPTTTCKINSWISTRRPNNSTSTLDPINPLNIKPILMLNRLIMLSSNKFIRYNKTTTRT